MVAHNVYYTAEKDLKTSKTYNILHVYLSPRYIMAVVLLQIVVLQTYARDKTYSSAN